MGVYTNTLKVMKKKNILFNEKFYMKRCQGLFLIKTDFFAQIIFNNIKY